LEHFGLKQKDIEAIRSVLQRYPEVSRAIIYGSRAKGNYRPGSDIDLTLKGSDALDFQTFCRIMGELDDLLLPYRIDLSRYSTIKDPDLIDHIHRVGRPLYPTAPSPSERQ
jgi:predicted nucleotidyltransferase